MNIEQKYKDTKSWGISCSIDLYECNPDTIRSAEQIRKFVYELCDLIKVNRFGECTVVNFGEREEIAGFSMTQLIETSLVSGHFANLTNTAYLDIFSCKYYDPETAANFARTFFEAKKLILNYNLRK